jgi:hypothetical protein
MFSSDALPLSPSALNYWADEKTFDVGWLGYPGGFPTGNGISTKNIVLTDITPVPIPGAVWLLGSGLIGFMGIRMRMKK